MGVHPAFSEGQVGLGTLLSEIRNPNIAAMLATAGVDFFIIDMEHGSYDWSSMAAMVTVGRAVGVHPFVRIPQIEREAVLKPLDAGAAGLVVPMVEHPEEAKEVLRHAKYAPQGRRGTALRRAHSHYRALPPREYMAQANEATSIAVQIETSTALDNLEDLAGVAGIDILFVGPFDLSVDLGMPGQLEEQPMRDAYARVVTAARNHGKVAGIHVSDVASARARIDEGYRMVSVGGDVPLIVDQTAANVETLRKA